MSRAAAQLLHRPDVGGVGAVVRHLLAVQAQDHPSSRLALRARIAGLRAADVDAALDRGELVVTWLGRGTRHLVHRDDVGWLHALTAPARLAGNRRRLAQVGIAPDAAAGAVARARTALAEEGPLTRAQLGARMGTPPPVTPHVLLLAALRGDVVLGPVRGEELAFALVSDWLGAPLRPMERGAALGELARRYLRAHAPATDVDLAHWIGLPLRDARAGLGQVAPPTPAADGGPAIAPRLLGPFDPYLLGWKDRGHLGPDAAATFPGGGVIRATATVGGRAVGTWSLRGGRVLLDPERSGFEAEVAEVEAFRRAPAPCPAGPARRPRRSST